MEFSKNKHVLMESIFVNFSLIFIFCTFPIINVIPDLLQKQNWISKLQIMYIYFTPAL